MKMFILLETIITQIHFSSFTWYSSDHLAFIFQSVKSIEERTRPNLCKTLKGDHRSSDQTWLPKLADNHDPVCVCVFRLFCRRAGPIGRTGTGRGRRHHAPDGSLQAQFHQLNVRLQRAGGRWVSWIPIRKLCHHRNTAIVAVAHWTPYKNLPVGRIERYINLESFNNIVLFFLGLFCFFSSNAVYSLVFFFSVFT